MDHTGYASTEITELAKAMLRVQASLSPALKDRDNPFTHSRYATLNSVMDACRESLLENGIWLAQYPVPAPGAALGQLALVSKLTHVESGQWQSSLMLMPLPKADPQGYGSALTYARRYALSTLLGMVTEDDDDGEKSKAGDQPPAARKGKKPTNAVAPAQHTQSPSEGSPHPLLAQLPKLDGIRYSTVTTQDNRLCIVAEGDTRAKKQLLQQAGFRWSEQRVMWWKYADAV